MISAFSHYYEMEKVNIYQLKSLYVSEMSFIYDPLTTVSIQEHVFKICREKLEIMCQ